MNIWQKKLFRLFMSEALLVLISLSMTVSFAFADASERYAQEAVRQYEAAIAIGFPAQPPVWSNDYNGHLAWSRHGENVQQTPMHLAGREHALQEFAVKQNINPHERYAQEAVRQYEAAVALGMPAQPPVWSDDYNGHLVWSRHGENVQQTPMHLAGREQALQEFAINKPQSGVSIGNVELDKKNPILIEAFSRAQYTNVLQRIRQSSQLTAQSMTQFIFQDALAPQKKSLSPIEDPVFRINIYGEDLFAVELGSSWDSLEGKMRPASALQPLQRTSTKNFSKLIGNADYVRTLDEYSRHIGVDASFSANALVYSASVKATFEQDKANNKYFKRYAANATYLTQLEHAAGSELKLTSEAAQTLRDEGIEGFYHKYGDCFIYAIQYGAGFMGVGSYKLHNSEVKMAFNAKAEGSTIGYSASVKTEIATAQKRENERRNIQFKAYGYSGRIPGSIKELQQDYSNFPNVVNKTGGTEIYYTVVKYDSLAEFQRIAGNQYMNLRVARQTLDELMFYDRKLQRMINNLAYIGSNPAEFKQSDRDKAGKLLTDARNLQRELWNDIRKVQQHPFQDPLSWKIDIQAYRNMKDFAPSSMFVRVLVDIPADLTDRAKMRDSKLYGWDDHEGPLIGWTLQNGDADVYATGGKIDANIHSLLQIAAYDSVVKLKQGLLIHENKGDHTKIGGENILTLYEAPTNYKIVGFKTDQANFYLRNLKAGATPVAAIDVTESPGIWRELHLIFDNTDGDHPYVGLFGTMDFFVEIEEQGWRTPYALLSKY